MFMGFLPMSTSDAEHDHIFDDCNYDISGRAPGAVIPLSKELPTTVQKMGEIDVWPYFMSQWYEFSRRLVSM